MTERSDRELARLFELDDAPGPARPVDDRRAAAIVAAAVTGAGFGPAGGGGGGGGLPHAKLGKLALLAGVGAIAIAIATVAWIATRDSSVAPVAVIAPSAIDAATTPIVAVAPPVIDAVPPAVVEPPEIDMPAVHEPKRPHPGPSPGPKATPEDLLAEANGERTAHHWSEADALYARVVALPHVPRLAVQTALVASASLHLEHLADPRGATHRFRAALASGPNGALAEDARWGLAEAARATHDAAAERAALDDFLAHHASSPLASRARARRAAL